MSLILKGIDLPKGQSLIVFIANNGTVVCSDEDGVTTTEAIQIPKDHGKLIDGDLLKDTIRDTVPAWTIGIKIPTFGDTQIMSAIDIMPTILEAEEIK